MSPYEESALEIQMTADLLLLGGGKRPQVLGPVASAHSSFSKCLESAIANSKSLLISLQALLDFLRSALSNNSYNKQDEGRIVDMLTSSTVSLTEQSAHAAYHVAVDMPDSKPAVPGVIDLYRVSKARFLVERCVRQLGGSGAAVRDDQGKLAVTLSRSVAENVTVFVKACSRAAEHDKVPPAKREQLALLAQCLQGCSASFLTSLKSLPTEKDCHISLLFSKPLLAALDTCIDYLLEGGDVLLGRPAELGTEGHKVQLKILGIAMAVVSGCAKFLATAAELQSGESEEHRWQQLLKCQIAVTDASLMLTTLLRDHAPAGKISHKR